MDSPDPWSGAREPHHLGAALAELSEKWQLAVTQLREAGMSIYDLPWYLLIGEPQSGKSTTLKNSGLEFPVGADGLSGAGGTRNCDWWFSNEAVILDTAGRYATEEEDRDDDRHPGAALRGRLDPVGRIRTPGAPYGVEARACLPRGNPAMS